MGSETKELTAKVAELEALLAKAKADLKAARKREHDELYSVKKCGQIWCEQCYGPVPRRCE